MNNKHENEIKQFYYKKSRIQQYKGFCYTVQLGTIEKAAKKMGLSASAITMQIKSLEEGLNMQLFERNSNHRLIITNEGELFYNKLMPLIQKIDGIIEEFLLETKEKKSDIINIAAHHIIISDILPYIIKKHFNIFSNTKINIYNLPKNEAILKLKNDELDLILYPFDEDEKVPVELNFIPIFEFKLVVIANKKHPISKIKSEEISLKELKKYKFFHISNYMVSDMYKSFIKKNNNKIAIDLDRGNWDVAKNIVKADICLSSVGDFCITKEDKKSISYKYVPELFPNLYYALLTKQGKYINPVLDNFINETKNYKSSKL